jgi:hypothetical protein
MAKKRTEANPQLEAKGTKPDAQKNQSAPDQQFGEGNGGGESRVTTTPLASGLSTLEFNARVARKAYELFEARGRDEGRDVEDWLEAERLVKEELVQQSQAVA